MNAPIDDAHVMAVEATRRIRVHVADLHRQVAAWEPAPCPAWFGRPTARDTDPTPAHGVTRRLRLVTP